MIKPNNKAEIKEGYVRYRGKIHKIWKNGKDIVNEIITLGDDRETAYKKFIVEAYWDVKHPATKDRLKSYEIISFEEDNMTKPCRNFVVSCLKKCNDLDVSSRDRNYAKDRLYKAFRQYNPCWDDDGLADILSWCEDGILKEYCKDINGDYYEYLADNLLNELDHEWVCHYHPHESLDEQYERALAL